MHLFMKVYKFLLVLASFLFNTTFAAAAHDSDQHDPLSDGLTKKERARFIDAMQAYMLGTDTMLGLNQTCRYTKLEELSLCFPPAFFEVEPVPSKPHLRMVVYLKKGVSFSKALDSLISPLGKGEQRIIECKYAAHLAYLQGVRAVIANDEMFDSICERLTGGKKVEIWTFTDEHLFVKSKSAVPGGLCYLKQLDDPSHFSYSDGGRFWSSPYETKHLDGVNMGINLILTNGGCCAFFEPGVSKEMSIKKAATLMMDLMNADLSAEEIAYRQQYQLTPEQAQELNQIKYKDPQDALKQILSSALYFTPDFKKIIACRDEIRVAQKTRLAALAALGMDSEELDSKPKKKIGKKKPGS